MTIGGLMLFHGIGKLQHGVGGIARGVDSHGLPHFVAYGVYLGEVVAPALVLIGFLTRPAAVVMAINMLIAVWMVHTSDLFHRNAGGGWMLELQGLYCFGALAVALLGAGRYSASRGVGRWD